MRSCHAVVIVSALLVGCASDLRPEERKAESTLDSQLQEPCGPLARTRIEAVSHICSEHLESVRGVALVTVSGIYSVGFESSVLTPGDASEPWWVEFDQCGNAVDRVKALAPRANAHDLPPTTLLATFSGFPLGSGECGHMGQYRRAFLVTEVVDLRPLPAADHGR